MSNPVPSDQLIDLKSNAEVLDDFTNSDSASVTTRTGKKVKTLSGINAEANSAIADTGWFVIGTFAAGFTYTAGNQVGTDANGNQWSYNGSLPFTVTAGTVPNSPDYTNRGDAALRSELFSSYGIRNVSNGVVAVESIADLSGLPAEVVRFDLSYSVGGFGAIPGGEFDLVSDSSLSENYLNVINYAGDQYFVRKGVHFRQLEFTVGPAGDYETLNELIRAQSLKRKVYTGPFFGSGLYFIRAVLKPNYVFNEQIIAFGGVDLSWLQIDGEEREYTVEMSSITRLLASDRPLFGASSNSILPFITNMQFRPDNSGDGQPEQSSRSCIYVRQLSKVLFSSLDINGFPGVGVHGEYFAEIEGRSSNVRNNSINFRIRHDSFLHGRSPAPAAYGNTTGYEWDCTGATQNSVFLDQMGSIYIRSADHRGTPSSEYGILITDCPGAGFSSFATSASRVFVRNSILTIISSVGVSEFGFTLLHFGKLFCRGDLTVSSLLAFYGSEVVSLGSYAGGHALLIDGSKGVFNDFTLDTPPATIGHVLELRTASDVVITGSCSITGTTNYNVHASGASKVYLPVNSDLTYEPGVGSGAVRAQSGSNIYIGGNSDCTRDGTPRSADIRIGGPGSVIQVSGAVLGGTWVTPNEITFDGIIYRSV